MKIAQLEDRVKAAEALLSQGSSGGSAPSGCPGDLIKAVCVGKVALAKLALECNGGNANEKDSVSACMHGGYRV